MIPFTRNADGTLAATFTPAESELLASLAVQVTEMLDELARPGDEPLPGLTIGGSESLPDDPALARLLPDAYADGEAATEFRRLTERGLASRKVANANTVVATLGPAGGAVELDAQQAGAWLRSITDIRLSVAARLGIDDEAIDDERPVDEVDEVDDSTQAMIDVYDWLAGVQESLLHVMT